jgi:hypothetical protein
MLRELACIITYRTEIITTVHSATIIVRHIYTTVYSSSTRFPLRIIIIITHYAIHTQIPYQGGTISKVAALEGWKYALVFTNYEYIYLQKISVFQGT